MSALVALAILLAGRPQGAVDVQGDPLPAESARKALEGYAAGPRESYAAAVARGALAR